MANRLCTIYVIEEEHQMFGETHRDETTFESLEWAKLEMEERFKVYKKLAKHEIEWHKGEKLVANLSGDKDYFCVYDGGQQIIATIKQRRVKRYFGFNRG